MDLTNKVITVSAIEVKAGAYGNMAKIKDEQGLTYTVFEKKKDNTISEAWKNLPAVGSAVQIGYVEEQKTHPEHGAYTARTIRSFNSDIGQGVVNHQTQTKTPHQGANTASEAKDDRFWDMKAYKQCLWGYWLDAKKDVPLTERETELVWVVFRQIETDAKKRFFDFDRAVSTLPIDKLTNEPLPEELPVVDVNADLDVSDIPF